MSPRLHPDEDLLVAFAAGSLDYGPRLAIGIHLGVCRECARTTALAEAVGGALLEGLTPIPLAEDALQRALAGIERPAPAPAPPVETPEGWIAVPRAVALAARSRRWIVPGAWVAPIRRGPGQARTYLLGMRRGMGVLTHEHDGDELTLVLKGALLDNARVGHAGDFLSADDDIRHSPSVHGDEECVCLVASKGPMVPVDLLGRVMLAVARI